VAGREPQEKQQYYSPRVIWFLVILVGVALLVVGLTIFSEDRCTAPEFSENGNRDAGDSLQMTDSFEVEPSDDLRYSTSADLIPWKTFTRGMEELKESARFRMIYFTSDDCDPCREMEQETFSDLNILARIDEFIIPIKIDASSDRIMDFSGRMISESEAADFFNIPGYPSLLFYDGYENRFLFALPGITEPAKLGHVFDYLQEHKFRDSSITLNDYLSAREAIK